MAIQDLEDGVAPAASANVTVLRRRLAAVHREEARLHLELAAAIEAGCAPAEPRRPKVGSAKRLRGVAQLPSGNFRMRLHWGAKTFSSTHSTEEAAIAARTKVLVEIAAGRRGHHRSAKDVCGISPLRSWPSVAGVYFCCVPGIARVKIGTALDIARRLGELRYGVPDLVLLAHVPGGRAEEAELHRRFAPLRVAGEWFRLEADLLDHVRTLRVAT